jgi:hypothetical protein
MLPNVVVREVERSRTGVTLGGAPLCSDATLLRCARRGLGPALSRRGDWPG